MDNRPRRRSNRQSPYEGGGFSFPGLGGVLTQYPCRYERRFFSNDGASLFIRPIKPDDALMLVALFDCLSAQTIFYRFLRYLKSLPPEWVEHFTRIDYDRDVALAALETTASKERIVGVCRIMRSLGSLKGEVAVVVGDPWQRRGIGSTLLEECIRISRELGMKSLWGLVSVDNAPVMALATKFGFHIKGHAELGTTELEMTF